MVLGDGSQPLPSESKAREVSNRTGEDQLENPETRCVGQDQCQDARKWLLHRQSNAVEVQQGR